MFTFLKSTPARVATILLLLQGGILYNSIRPEYIPDSPPLSRLPTALGSWNQMGEPGVVDKETMEVLKADDTLSRNYQNGRAGVNLFVAGFRSQRTGKAPHSPKNCLPGSGWSPIWDGQTLLDVDRAAPISVNRYIIQNGEQKELVYYWYQSRDRAVAGEFRAKFWVIADAIRYNRTDTALVRVIIPIQPGDEKVAIQAADTAASDFVKSFYSTLLHYLPA